ncbi:uncharacterized protein LOC117958756 isoform X2 [Etheostoma cragini]|uniref:uncharacterized protein LOC117958756 isoform X2 n=1 Tax=Etheostoma cragini TaxID=417921 RepID=UPI00155E801B|nr:uncharacterized protein LOC117958756 isoform X2 [Etheostoma cragini]
MSLDGTKLLFEGFLQKRKDTMKIRWVTYWFRLQNTTLFFYTQKNGSAVQSVREVQRVDSKRFMFEIFMTNGKRKLLAAETAALRKEWVGLLWQAMNLSTSVVSDSRSTQHEVCEQRGRLNSSTPISSHSDCVMELMPARPLSAPAPTGHVHHKIRNIASPICLSEEPEGEEAVQQNTLSACSYQHHNSDSPQWSGGLSNAEGRQEGDYDILPLRTKVCEINPSTETEEGVYDFPLSYRRADEHPNPTESIYDVPSSLLRRIPDHTLEEQPEDEVYWRI